MPSSDTGGTSSGGTLIGTTCAEAINKATSIEETFTDSRVHIDKYGYLKVKKKIIINFTTFVKTGTICN